MAAGIWFWIFMALWFFFGLYWNYDETGTNARTKFGGIGGHVLHFILFLLLGWRQFGPPLQ